MTPEKKLEFYLFIKDFNQVIHRPVLFILFWGFKPVFSGLQNYIERKYFSTPKEFANRDQNKHIIEQLNNEFAEDWAGEELDIYNFL